MNIIQQLSVFLENKTGRVTQLTGLLGKAGINLSAFTIAESSDFGIMRVIVSDPEKACRLLSDNGFAVSLTDVLCLQIPNSPGAMAKIMQIVSENGVSIEYMYAFSDGDHARVVVCPDRLEDCLQILQRNSQRLLEADEMYSF